ncbi:sulfite reductase subunit alpha [Pseudomonas mangrovi]|uniref:NADPH--hemoprotein reductase n=1 Tax=Pseudomonas mangrovi TaxID=2161748 RepID=A0A2T5PF34_9PSED|nr:sulfite reductase flavoprotein subunit alpha [Pseudomonas mangrovi]PTU76339.1 sulfite reductase [Pseudomonas mangrovi]
MKRPFRLWLLLAAALSLLLIWLEPPRALSAALAAGAWLVLCVPAWRQHRATHSVSTPMPADIWLAYASQGGQAREIAERSATQLNDAGVSAVARNLAELSPVDLVRARRLLLVASTYGEGEAPDQAARFERLLDTSKLRLEQLEYAVLALGDRNYRQFCAFGRRLDQRLEQLGARPLQDRLEVDRGEPAALRQWQQFLGQLAGDSHFSDWQTPSYQRATLLERHCLNPGSAGGAAYLVRLQAPTASHWRAGDILEVGPCNAGARVETCLQHLQLDGRQIQADGETLRWHLARRQLPADDTDLPRPDHLLELPRLAHRDYSIASLGEDGVVELLVRLRANADGNLGSGSGWLCRHAAPGEEIDVRLRANPGFRLAPQAGPLILIGNGTGIAGLRAHLLERERLGQHGHWLLFGERNAAHDLFFAEELQGWCESGHLARLDLAFSRDQAEPVYVQHLLRDAGDELRAWVGRGASILVCGSLTGMGQEIEALLHGLLGDEQVLALRSTGRYRRDLY